MVNTLSFQLLEQASKSYSYGRPVFLLPRFPEGTWRGPEELPEGTWRGPEELPEGTWRGPEELPEGTWRGPEELPEGTWRVNYSDEISFANGNSYEFRFYDSGNGYEIDIIDQPSYSGRSSNLHTTHRLPSSRPDAVNKICFEPNPNSFDEAHAVAEKWAQYTERYISTGIKWGGKA